MKRQSFMQNSGFTIFELMIVIAMILIFYAAMIRFSATSQNDSEKVNRIKYTVSDILRAEILRMEIGRMPINDGRVSDTTVIQISTGGILTMQKSEGTILSSGAFIPPYYDNDPYYSLSGVLWMTGSSMTSATSSGMGEVILTKNSISFSGTNIGSDAIILHIDVGYNARTRWIELDRRTGRISIQS